MSTMRITMQLSLFAALAFLASADKDSDYYYPGFINPNTKRAMYWKDSINVLQDLDQFEALYVTYHHCVWSNYGQRYGSGEDYDEQGGDGGDNDSDNGCGGYGGEYYWYMGRTQCFKANVAYSLYGVLKGDKVPDNACRKSTYINSFFTTNGVESFTGPLGLDDGSASSQCTSVEPEYAYIDDDAARADDDYLDDNFQLYDYPAYTSYGTGCSAKKKFVTDSYQGAFCHGRNYLETIDTLDDFNEAISAVECMQIYSSSSNAERRTEEDQGNYEDMDSLGVLSYSRSCSLRQYPNDCPDPHGLKKKYSKAIDHAFGWGYAMGRQRNIGLKAIQALSWICLAGGVLFLVLAFLHKTNIVVIRNKKRKWFKSLRRKKSKGKSHSKMGKRTSRKRTRSLSRDSTRMSRSRSLSRDSTRMSRSWSRDKS